MEKNPGMCNTNVDGRQKVMFALTAIRGMGRRISNIVCALAGEIPVFCELVDTWMLGWLCQTNVSIHIF